MNNQQDIADSILLTALDIAEHHSWEALRLHHIAAKLSMPLDDIRRHFRQKDDLVEAWFDLADKALLDSTKQSDYYDLEVRDRLYLSISAWLDVLASHKKITRDMLMYKLEPGHIHLQILGVMRVSRTVQWLREAAHLDSIQLVRIAEEIGLTTLYLQIFGYWLFDLSDNQQQSKNYLKHKLERSAKLAKFMHDILPY